MEDQKYTFMRMQKLAVGLLFIANDEEGIPDIYIEVYENI